MPFNTLESDELNRFVCSIALAFADGDGDQFNPLWTYGGSKSERTNLLNAIGNRALQNDSLTKVCFTNGGQLAQKFIKAVDSLDREREEFSIPDSSFDQVDVLLVDDVQSLVGDELALRVFFRLLDVLCHTDRRIAIASEKAPTSLKRFESLFRLLF